jgi:hypothetical protein
MAIRKLFYRMVGLNSHEKAAIGGFENDDRHYKLVSLMMTKAREEGRVPYEWIVDRSRPTYMRNVFRDLHGYSEAVKAAIAGTTGKPSPCTSSYGARKTR